MQPILLTTTASTTTIVEPQVTSLPANLHNNNDDDDDNFPAAEIEILQNLKSDVFINKSSNSANKKSINNYYYHYDDSDDNSNKQIILDSETTKLTLENLNFNKSNNSNSGNHKKITTTNNGRNSDKLKRVSSDISNSKSLSLKYFDNKYGSKLRKNSSDYAILTSGNKQHQQPQNLSDLKITDNSPLLVLGATTQPTVVESTTTNKQPQKFFNLKKNGATLIFQKKSQKYCEDVKKRRSLQWSTIKPETDDSNRNSKISYRHSWYEQSYPDIKEELSVDSQDNNLAGTKNINIGTPAESASLIDKSSNRFSSEAGVGAGSEDVNYTPTDQQPQNPPRRRRIEQFLKSLVGKKPSREPVIVPINHHPPAPLAFSEVSKFPSEHNLLLNNNNSSTIASASTNDLSNRGRLLNTSTASLNSLSIVQQKLWSVVPILGRKDGNSCSNLLHSKTYAPGFPGSPGLRKCETVLALTNEPTKISTSLASGGNRSQSLHERTAPHSKSINNLVEPIKPLNRLRYSSSCYNNVATSLQTCSRCSSLLSLAAAGSKYSLTTNGAFVPSITSTNHNNQHAKCAKSLVKRGSHDHDEVDHEQVDEEEEEEEAEEESEENDDDGILVDSLSKTNSSNNLILNDFNEIEPYDKSLSKQQQPKIISPVQTQQQQSIAKCTCKLCLGEYSTNDKLTKISSCGCYFCTECMKAYVEFEITEGAYEVSCPDALCPSQGVISITEISQLATPSLVTKHHRYRLNREVELDKYRTWCPKAGCETICLVGPSTSEKCVTIQQPSSSNSIIQIPRAVHCPTCREDFCSGCKKPWHPVMTCEENTRHLAANGQSESMMIFDNDLIKCCPMCAVPIEKDEGCAQMMCKRCKHVFCWYCLASLDDDFLLRHYDKGPCKNKLGHSRASVVWHRAQVIGIFAGFGILLLVASPLLLLAAPCIVCCKCRICSGAKLEDQEADYDEGIALQR